MKKLLLVIGFLLGTAAFAAAQPTEPPQLRQIAAQSQLILAHNTNQDCYEFTRRFLAALNDPHWGHVGKTRGEGQFPMAGLGNRVGRDGNTYAVSGVSHDAAYYCAQPDGHGGCNYSSGDWQVDLLGNGNDGPDPLGSPASPQWNVIPQQFYRPNNPFIGVTNSSPSPTPVPQPAPTVDLSDVLRKLDAIAARLDTLESVSSATRAGVASVADRIESVLLSNDRIVRQLLSPPTYTGRVVGIGLTLKPTVVPVNP